MKQFYLPTKVITGWGCFNQLPNVVRVYGQRSLLVCGRSALRSSGALERALDALHKAGVCTVLYDAVPTEPTLDVVQAAVDLARREQTEVVIGIGGGSAMDVAKASAVLYTQAGTVEEHHRGRPVTERGLPCVAVPTTAGTGTEVTNNAVLTDPGRGVKESLRGAHIFAAVALLDPELTLSLPPSVTASSGADALCQAIEAFVAALAQPPTDALAGQGIEWIGRSLVRAYEQGSDVPARSDMLYGSLLAGMAMTNARLGGAHALAHPLGYLYHIPHGVVCGLLLPYIMEYSLDSAPAKYAEVARRLQVETRGLSPREAAAQGVEAVRRILQQIGIPARLAPLGVRREDFSEIIAKALPSANLKNNPRSLGPDDLQHILAQAL